jgi:hypothetical protein
MAPGANLVEQVYSLWYTQPGGMLLLMTESYRNGGSLSGNSWGPSSSPAVVAGMKLYSMGHDPCSIN